MILEYLVKNNFSSSIEVFKRELSGRSDELERKNHVKTLLHHFDNGLNKEFTSLWEKMLQETELNSNLKDDLGKLEFYFQIYFCIFWIHSKGKNMGV